MTQKSNKIMECLMGCDIHLAVESKTFDEWYFVGLVYVWRNYDLFAEMASVRGSGKYPPRGWPDDICATTRYYLEPLCDHSHSWLSAKELLSIKLLVEEDDGELEEYTPPLFHIIRGYCKAYGGKKNIRVVFGFDS